MQMNLKTEQKSFRFADLINNKFLIILSVCLVLGIFIGSVSVPILDENYSKFLEDWITSYINFRTTAGFIKVFFSVFLSLIVFIALILVSSFGVGGLAILPILMFFRGFGTAVIAGFLYRNYSLEGIAFADLILLPSVVAVDVIFLYFSNDAFSLSYRFFELIRDVSSRGIEIRPSILIVFKRCVFSLIAVVIASIVEAGFTVCFIKYFNFT